MIKTRSFFEELMIPDPGIFVVFKYFKMVSRLVLTKTLRMFLYLPPLIVFSWLGFCFGRDWGRVECDC